MAQPSTTYKIDLNLTDIDRSIYESLRFTVARHPSETEERLAARLIAQAALDRRECRGGHYRSDYPQTDGAAVHTRVRIPHPAALEAAE